MNKDKRNKFMKKISSNQFSFRHLQETDLDLLCHWLNQPHVREWWNDNLSSDEIKSVYKARIGNDIVVPFIAYFDNQPIGFIQYYHANKVGDGWWPDEVAGTMGIDQFIGEPQLINRGIGTQMIRAFTDYLLHEVHAKKIITDVDPLNTRAIRCYEKAGFIFAGEIHTPDGLAHLMIFNNNKNNSEEKIF